MYAINRKLGSTVIFFLIKFWNISTALSSASFIRDVTAVSMINFLIILKKMYTLGSAQLIDSTLAFGFMTMVQIPGRFYARA